MSPEERQQREHTFGPVLDRPAEDGRLGWGLLIGRNEGAWLLGVSWSVEQRLRERHRRLVGEQRDESFDTWMLTVPGAVPTVHQDLFVDTVDGAVMIDVSVRSTITLPGTLQAYVQAVQTQACERAGENPAALAPALFLNAAQRPTARFTQTLFVDEALTHCLAQHVRTFAEQAALQHVLAQEQVPVGTAPTGRSRL